MVDRLREHIFDKLFETAEIAKFTPDQIRWIKRNFWGGKVAKHKIQISHFTIQISQFRFHNSDFTFFTPNFYFHL